MSAEELALIERCLRVTVESDLYEDWEFSTIMGMSRADMAAVLGAWPDAPSGYLVETGDQMRSDAVRSALNNLAGYPHPAGAVEQVIPEGRDAIRPLLVSWNLAAKALEPPSA